MLIIVLWLGMSGCEKQEGGQSITIEAQKGVLDIGVWNSETDGEMIIKGEWEFYWLQLLHPKDIKQQLPETKQYISLPKYYTGMELGGETLPSDGYATYRLIIQNSGIAQQTTLKVGEIMTSYDLWLNGEKIITTGKIGTKQADAKADAIIKYKNIELLHGDNELICRVSNFSHRNGGINSTFVLSNAQLVADKRAKKIFSEVFLMGSFFIMALYHFVLFFLRTKELSSLVFGVYSLIIAVRVSVTGSKFMEIIFPNINYDFALKIEYMTFYLAAPVFITFVYEIYREITNRKIVLAYQLLSLLFILLVIFTPGRIFSHSLTAYQLTALLAIIYITFVLIQSVRKHLDGSIILLLGGVLFFIAIINDILYFQSIFRVMEMTSIGVFIIVFSQSIVLAIKFTNAAEQSEELARELDFQNMNLESIVKQRTSEIQQQQEEIMAQRDEVQAHNELIRKQNKEITASIHYARRIQIAALPPSEFFENSFVEHFVFYQPRDIVSGDFYWFKQINYADDTLYIIAVADSTGHGVPGAFVSMLGISMLNNVVARKKNTSPNLILEDLRTEVKQSLQQTGKQGEQKDGMDMALCIIHKKKRLLEFAGAYNPLYIYRGKELIEIKGTKSPIGIFIKEQTFKNTIIELQKGDRLYMFTDGFADQINSNKRKFFVC